MTVGGIGRSAPWVQIAASLVRGLTTRSSRPTACIRSRPFGTASQDRLRTEVERQTADLAEQQLAADPARSLEHDDVSAASRQLMGSGEPGHATADDSDAHDQAS